MPIYPNLFFFRRIFYATMVVIYPKFRVLHLFIYSMMNIAVFICLFYIAPYDGLRNNLEKFNEVIILILLYHLFCYTEFLPDH